MMPFERDVKSPLLHQLTTFSTPQSSVVPLSSWFALYIPIVSVITLVTYAVYLLHNLIAISSMAEMVVLAATHSIS